MVNATNRLARLTFVAFVLGLPFCATAAARGQNSASESELIEVLTSSAEPAAKAAACKTLAIRGGRAAVPALAALLSDPQLSSWARIALQTIPDPAAAAALRDCLGRLEGRLLIGAVNSLAVRRDTDAAPALAGLLGSSDTDVQCAAAVALGQIGGPTAAADLKRLLTATASEGVRSAAAEGLIRLAERLASDGKQAEAAELFDLVRTAPVPKLRALEATRGAILARGGAGLPLLVEQLRSDDKAAFRLGLSVARELEGPETGAALIAEFSRATEARQPLLLLALSDRGDPAAMSLFKTAVMDARGEVRATAATALGRVGGDASVPLLFDVAATADDIAAVAAFDALAHMHADGVDATILAELKTATGRRRVVAIDLAGRRAIAAAAAPLLAAADDGDVAVRVAAIRALGSTVGAEGLPALIERLGRGAGAEADAAGKAVVSVIRRASDQEAASRQVAAAAATAEEAARVRHLEVLATVGGSPALEAVAAAARDSKPVIREAGTRLLGEWMTLDAAPLLLEQARTAADSKYKTRGLRGYLRLVRQFPIPNDERVRMCREALAAAERDDERMLVVEVLERHPSRTGLDLAIELSKTPTLDSAASRVALAIAAKLNVPKAEVEAALSGSPPSQKASR